MKTDPELPIYSVLSEVRERLESDGTCALEAPPGAGKSTALPLELLALKRLQGGKILMLEPRRLAARSVAARMASSLGENVGETIGYTIRFERRVSPRTRIEVVTEGVLTRRLQRDPALEGVSLLIFDEFHERNLHSDLALALALDARRGLREDLMLLLMSATLDFARAAELIGAATVQSAGRSYPIAVRYAGGVGRSLAESAHLCETRPGEFAEHAARTIRRELAASAGDALVFLPGAGEIRRVLERLESAPLPDHARVLPLYGDLSAAEQDRVFTLEPGGRRRVTLATNIAETSLTIPGVTLVIDTGLERAARFDPSAGLTRLVTRPIARAQATQRAGRAGRLAPGAAVRLWNELEERDLQPYATPEILESDLAPLALELAAWGAPDPLALAWLDPPPGAHYAEARALLLALGALDSDGRATALGREMARLPVHPRLARLLLAGREWGVPELAAEIAALLSERDILPRRGREDSDASLALRLDQLRSSAADRAGGALRRVQNAARQLRELVQTTQSSGAQKNAPRPGDITGRLLAVAYPDRIARRRGAGERRYLLCNGKGAALGPRDSLADSEFLVVADADSGDRDARIYIAAPLERASIEELFAGVIQERESIEWNERTDRVEALRETRLGALTLAAKPLLDVSPEGRAQAWAAGLRARGAGTLPWSDEARRFRARVEFLRAHGESFADCSDEGLVKNLDEWLTPFLNDVRSPADLKKVDLAAALRARFAWNDLNRIDDLAPETWLAPSGSNLRLEYNGPRVALAVKLQELFGLAETPTVLGGRVKIVLELLSPARRPIQVTEDLRGFWDRTYPEVKKELKGRYPKHPWPDDPWSAAPTRFTKKRAP